MNNYNPPGVTKALEVRLYRGGSDNQNVYYLRRSTGSFPLFWNAQTDSFGEAEHMTHFESKEDAALIDNYRGYHVKFIPC